jgi:hypothetical protein
VHSGRVVKESMLSAALFAIVAQGPGLPVDTTRRGDAVTSLERAQPITFPPAPSRFALESPLPRIPGVVMDRMGNRVGVAQEVARERGLQGRMLWVDATANIDRVNTEEKIVELMAQVRRAGFNTVVFDIKPISGQTMYPSRYAPKVVEWRGRRLPPEFDPMLHMSREAKRQGLSFWVALNAFSEGHRMFLVGPGYENPHWLTVLYEPHLTVRTLGPRQPIRLPVNTLPEDQTQLGLFLDPARVPAGVRYAAVDAQGTVIATGTRGEQPIALPVGGRILVGRGPAAAWLENYAFEGWATTFATEPTFVPITERPEQQIPLMVNPNHPEVQDRALAILREVIENYEVEGLLYDDRLRYGGMNADFSELTRSLFEQYVGRRLSWPDDVFRFNLTRDFQRGIVPGPYYDAWMAWRALQMRNFLTRVRHTVSAARKGTQFGYYVGSWYGEYPVFGHNWASPYVNSGFWFQTPEYRKAGTAPLVDMVVTGGYYPTPTMTEAMANATGIGTTVEGAGQLSNRMVRDEAWTYVGIMLSQFKDDPRRLERALQAATGSTQGVMVFDLSHDIEPFWPVFERAFGDPRRAPHTVPGLLEQVRRRRLALDRSGYVEPPVLITAGAAGTGH